MVGGSKKLTLCRKLLKTVHDLCGWRLLPVRCGPHTPVHIGTIPANRKRQVKKQNKHKKVDEKRPFVDKTKGHILHRSQVQCRSEQSANQPPPAEKDYNECKERQATKAGRHRRHGCTQPTTSKRILFHVNKSKFKIHLSRRFPCNLRLDRKSVV